MNECIFCKIIEKDIPSHTIYEDTDVYAFLDIYPKTKGHVIVIPKDHYQDIFDISEKTLGHIAHVAKRIAVVAKNELGAEGVNLWNNNGPVAQQEIMHYHMHVIPRYDDNQKILFETSYDGKDFEDVAKTLVRGL